jgi:hypothetical protein
LEQVEKRRDLQNKKPAVVDRLALWFSTSRNIDGLWVGTVESKPWPGLRRVEEALQLIKSHDSLHYSRVINNLGRIWVQLLTGDLAHYERSLKACVFDERYVVQETTTTEWIASTIVHEATHARMERWGVIYEENKRGRIEAICIRRELNFVARLPRSEALQEEAVRRLEWCAGDHDHFSNASFQQREVQGQIEALRYLGAPDWVFGFAMKLRALRRWIHGFAGRVRRQA